MLRAVDAADSRLCFGIASHFDKAKALAPARVAVIGDDIEIDVRGAQLMGMQGWLVKSGRFRKEDLGRGIWPDRLLDNITELVRDTQ